MDDVLEPPVWTESVPTLSRTDNKSRRTLSIVRGHDWIVGLLYMTCDILCWVVLYGAVSYIRRDEFFVSPFEFMLVDCVVLVVILQALYSNTSQISFTSSRLASVVLQKSHPLIDFYQPGGQR